MTRFSLSPLTVLGVLAASSACAQEWPAMPLLASLSPPASDAPALASMSTRDGGATQAALAETRARRERLAYGPSGPGATASADQLPTLRFASEMAPVRTLWAALAGARGGLRSLPPAATFSAAKPTRSDVIFTKPNAPAAKSVGEDGLAASGGLELGSRLTWVFESGFRYDFSENLTGMLGYGDVSTDGGEIHASLDGPSLGFTFRF